MIRLKTRLALVERGEPVPDGDDPRDPGEGLGVIGSGVGGLGVGVRNEVSGMGLVPGTGHSHGSGTVSVNDPSVHSTAGNGTSQHR